jgi:hypothetical protein
MSAPAYRKLTTISPAVDLDPSAPGTFIRYSFPVEGTFNIICGLAMIIMPYRISSYLVIEPSEINNAAASPLQ